MYIELQFLNAWLQSWNLEFQPLTNEKNYGFSEIIFLYANLVGEIFDLEERPADDRRMTGWPADDRRMTGWPDDRMTKKV